MSADGEGSGEVVGIVVASLVLVAVVLAAGFLTFGLEPPTAPAPTTYTTQAGTGGAVEATGIASQPPHV